MELYEFFKSQGAVITNDVCDFSGTNGCYLFQGREAPQSKLSTLKDQILVIAPHEGIVPSETWLKCRRKILNNTTFNSGHKGKYTWLCGKVKCAKCGTGLVTRKTLSSTIYFFCRRRTDNKSCGGCGTLRVQDIENFVFRGMCRRLADFRVLAGNTSGKANPKLTALKVSLAQVEADIEKLVNTLTGANSVLLSYANSKVEELDSKRQLLIKQIANMSADSISPKQLERISHYLDSWDEVSYEDKRFVVDCLISRISAESGKICIEWKF